MSEPNTAWPTEIRLKKDRRTLVVTFDDGVVAALEAEMLRVMSPSAEVQGHSPEQRVLVAGKKNVEIAAIDPVGNYAVRLTFNDGHATGLFSWVYLRTLHEEREKRSAEYFAELAAKGLSRG